jgi:uncharacterized cofD-like protein
MSGLVVEPAVELDPFLLDPAGPRVVAIGGGHGLSVTLKAVQMYASEITAVVSVADDGGSSGRLTAGLGIPPPGDIRRCLLALTPEPSVWSELFAYRFGDPDPDQARDVEGHSLGNLILAALTDLAGDFASAVRRAGELLGAVGTVIPAATQPIRLSAVIDGRTVEGQVAVARARGRIERLLLGPDDISAHPAALEAISRADQIVLGPGSLFTSILAALRVPGIAEAVEASPGELVFVLNLVTQDGETLGLSGADHLVALADHGHLRRTGTVLVHQGELRVPDGLEPVGVDELDAASLGWKAVYADVADHEAEWPAHHPAKLGKTLAALG